MQQIPSVQQEVGQFVEYDVFVPIIIGIVSIVLTSVWILFGYFKNENRVIYQKISLGEKNISNVKSRLSVVETQNQGDSDNIKDIWTRIESMERQRATDVIQFTEALGKLNNTLGKIEVTLENSNNVMEKIEKRLEDQDKEITRLKVVKEGK